MSSVHGIEKTFVISTSDRKEICGFVHTPIRPTKTAVVLVHGLTGSMSEYIHCMLAKQLCSAGFAVVRFDQYGDGENQRRFHTSTISVHASDTRSVIEYARSLGFERIILAGHSLGSPVAIMAMDSGVVGLILIDPTGDPKQRIKEWEVRDPDLGFSFLDWRVRIVLGAEWIEDAKRAPDPYELYAKVECPTLVIAAECADQMQYCVRYREARPTTPEIVIIPGASHCFTEQGTVETLGDVMIQWSCSNLMPVHGAPTA
jgi:pimeloyl-ACP methyl ester carboxylesterase